MPSVALQRWMGARATALDEIETAHRAVGGSAPGRRTATLQLNQAYALLLSAQFQAFCRELHTECADYLVAFVAEPTLRSLFRYNLVVNRKVDWGNPTAGNIGSDFNRLSLPFWSMVDAHRASNPRRKSSLEELNAWRNAIAHQDFTPSMLTAGRPALGLARVQLWRRACEGLARSFDAILRLHLRTVRGAFPWS